MTVRARLVAEVVETVLAADPSAATGTRGFEQVFPLSIDLVVAHLDSEGVNYVRLPSDDVIVGLFGPESVPKVVVDIGKPSSDMLCLLAKAPGLAFEADAQSRLRAFVADWNSKSWLPTATATVDDATGNAELGAEIVVPLGAPVTRLAVDVVMRRCLRSILDMYQAAAQRLVWPADEADGREG